MKHLKTQLALLSIISLFVIFPVSSKGQNGDRVNKKYITHRIQAELENLDPSISERRAQIEEFIDGFDTTQITHPIILPVIFHIFNKSDGQKLVSESQVEAQIQALNRDFGNIGYISNSLYSEGSFFQSIADLDIEFCLAVRNFGGTNINGIHYIQANRDSWPVDQSIKNFESGGITPWDPSHLINIWVAPLENGVRGFAQMPGGPDSTDGIVIDYRFFGRQDSTITPYFQGKTLTHLIGNYLNLFDLYRGTGKCIDDKVSDTPIHNAPHTLCKKAKHISTCNGYPTEMIMNFMDNTCDECLTMFTKGQKNRMYATLSNEEARKGLVSNGTTSCEPDGVLRLQDPNAQINQSHEKNRIQLFPNPTTDMVHLGLYSLESNPIKVEIFSPLGARVYRGEFDALKGYQTFPIECRKFAAGIYSLRIQIQDEFLLSQLIID